MDDLSAQVLGGPKEPPPGEHMDSGFGFETAQFDCISKGELTRKNDGASPRNNVREDRDGITMRGTMDMECHCLSSSIT